MSMRKYAKDKGAFDKGYAWAISELAKGTSRKDLEAKCDGAIDYSDFDRGASDALREVVVVSRI